MKAQGPQGPWLGLAPQGGPCLPTPMSTMLLSASRAPYLYWPWLDGVAVPVHAAQGRCVGRSLLSKQVPSGIVAQVACWVSWVQDDRPAIVPRDSLIPTESPCDIGWVILYSHLIPQGHVSTLGTLSRVGVEKKRHMEWDVMAEPYPGSHIKYKKYMQVPNLA